MQTDFRSVMVLKVLDWAYCGVRVRQTFCLHFYRLLEYTCYHLENVSLIHALEKGVLTFNDPKGESFENTVGKGENAGNQHFLPFPQCFLLYQREKLPF